MSAITSIKDIMYLSRFECLHVSGIIKIVDKLS